MSKSLLLFPLLLVAAFLSLKEPSLIYSDAADYLMEAHKLWAQGTAIFSEGFLHRYWKPTFFPLWSSFFFFPTNGSFHWGASLCLLAGLAVFIFSLYGLLINFLTQNEALILTILLALQAPFLSSGIHFMSEGWALSFWVLSLSLYFSHLKRKLIYSGLSLGLGGMLSPVLTGLYFFPFYIYFLYDSGKKQKRSSLFLLWPLLPILVFALGFSQTTSQPMIAALVVFSLILAPLCLKTCPRPTYLLISLGLILPFLWYAFHLSMLWDWIQLSSFSHYANETGKFSLQRFKEYQGYLDFLPMSLGFFWLLTLGLLLKTSFPKKKEILLGIYFVFLPLIMALSLSANGDLRYFKWPFFLTFLGLFILAWPQLSLHLKKVTLALLTFSALLSSLYLWQSENPRLGLIKNLHKEVIKDLPSKISVGVIPLGTQDNDILQSRAIFQFLSYQKGWQHDFNFLDERRSEAWSEKNYLLIGPCENKNEIDPSLPKSSKEFSKYCLEFSGENKLHFILMKNDHSKEIKIIELTKLPLL